MALRQTTGFVESLLHLMGLDWAVPDASTLSRRQKPLKVNIPPRGSAGPLHLLIDIGPVPVTGSSEPARGIKIEGEGEWTEEGQQTVRETVCPTKAQARWAKTPGLAQDTHRH